MALIELHPEVDNYILEMTLSEVRARGGVADLIEQGNIVIIKDFRLELDFDSLTRLEKSVDGVSDAAIRRKLKKLEATHFLEGQRPKRSGLRSLRFNDPLRQSLFDVICRGDRKLYARASAAVKAANEAAMEIFATAVPEYEAYRMIPSLRLTRTLFENLHWDNHSIDDDYHQFRLFANLDVRPRIWHVSHRLPEIMRSLYDKCDLSRFAGQDPNKLIDHIAKNIAANDPKLLDTLPRHRIAFEPGEVWLGESRLVAHQIYYGEAAMVYMWLISPSSMANHSNRFNEQVERVHREMQQEPQGRAAPVDG